MRRSAALLLVAVTTALALMALTLSSCDREKPASVNVAAVDEPIAAGASLTTSPPPSAPTAEPTPTPSPTPPPGPPPPRSLLADHQVVAYYGNPYSPVMGILGEYDLDELIRRLGAQAERYQSLNREKTVLGALHLIYAVAQADPGSDGSYLYHMPADLVERYIEATRAQGMLLFIDLQMGHADPVAEAQAVTGWLRHDHVHLAIDPEFTMGPRERPGVDLGSMDASVIDQIQAVLQAVATDAGVPNKILIVHQFQADMVTNRAAITDYDRVDLVIDLDGWGPPASKLEKYDALATGEPAEFTGFKLFYRWDRPMLAEEDVQALLPRPSVVIYQ